MLRIYLGAAPGVGKTFAMLNEGCRGKERGKDVVVGFVETHGRRLTAEQVRDLEVVPPRRVLSDGTEVEEMDVDAILGRRPEVALVDELAHTNLAGARNPKRWQDVAELLDAGIDVVSTLNIQHLESVNEVVERITGIKEHETIPDHVVRAAEQVELVDMTPEALRRRLAHGNVYAAEQIDAALANYFRPANLAALRELALLWVADRVDENIQSYMDQRAIAGLTETRERIIVAVKGVAVDEQLIRRGARIASRARGDLLCVHVRAGGSLASVPPDRVERDRRLTSQLGGTFHEVVGDDAARSLVEFARSEKVTQLVLGESTSARWPRFVRRSLTDTVIALSGPIDVQIVSEREHDTAAAPLRVRRPRLAALPWWRTLAGFAMAGLGMPLLTLVFASLRGTVGLPIILLVYLALVVFVAVVGGMWPALAAALGTSLLATWYFTPPFHRWTIGHGENVVALAVFVIVASVVSGLVSRVARRSEEAARARAEADVLARTAATLVGREDAIAELLAYLRSAFSLSSVAILRNVDGQWTTASSAGPVPERHDDDDAVVRITADTRLAVSGRPLTSSDRRVLEVFGAQLAAALERRVLQSRASDAEQLEATNRLRTALLAGVSHDLRTPLASIKASVTSLLGGDVQWSTNEVQEFLRAIDAETDRLNKLVGNLLDMSRLQTGGLDLSIRDVGLEEVVAPALAGLGERGRAVIVDVPDTLPRVRVDSALLERAVANVVENAIAHSPAEIPVRVEAGEAAGRVLLRLIDRGPGIPAARRERAVMPFQRLGDSQNATGVGLGLAVAKGFVEAMDGEFRLDDTPGGGLTVSIDLRVAPS